MEADDHQSACCAKHLYDLFQRPLKAGQFLVHHDPQCLERLCRRVNPAPRAYASLYHGGELSCRFYRTVGHDRPGYTFASMLLAVLLEDGGDLSFGIRIHDGCRSEMLRCVEPHIEECIMLEAEPTVRTVELER